MKQPKEKQHAGLRRSGVCKALMALTYSLSIIAVTVGSVFTAQFVESDMYTENQNNLSVKRLQMMCGEDIWMINDRFHYLYQNGYENQAISENYRQQLYSDFMQDYDPAESNFEFVITDAQEQVIFQTRTDAPVQYSRTEAIYETSRELILEERMRAEEWEEYAETLDMTDLDIDLNEIWVDEPITLEAIVTEPPTVSVPQDTSHSVTIPETLVTGPTTENGAPLIEAESLPPTENGEPLIEMESLPPDAYAVTEAQYPTGWEEGLDSAAEEMEWITEYEPVLYYDVTIHRVTNEISHYITGYLRSDLTADDKYSQYMEFSEYAYDYRYLPPVVLLAGIAAFVFSLSYLLWAAGYRRSAEAPICGFFDKIPLDVFSALIASAGIVFIVLLDDMLNTTSGILSVAVGTASLTAIGLLVLWWLMSIAVRIRTKTLLSNNLIIMAGKRIKKMTAQGAERVQNLPILWYVPLAALGFFLLNILGVALVANSTGFGLFFMMILYTAAIILSCLVIANMHLLERGAEKISGGDLDYKIPENQLFGPFRKHGRNLNNIGEGMNLAVSERIRSERFRTELIANVSHDIRTPLTSIINYTDLLSKLKLEDVQAQEYIEVLTRQSARLRKLTEDVLEASKATTGSIHVEKQTMDLRVMLEQIQGEYAEKLEQCQLQMISTVSDVPLYISADGRLLWRVMDNLFGNLCKYAMANTRVYLDASEENGRAVMVLRNISAVQLHITADMLMERFVQGDRSRNTEGSGLGLSIAQSLTTLQGGAMELNIDGDLFKVKLSFPIVKP